MLDGMLDPIAGTIVLNELHRLEQRMFDEDWADARAEHGDRATAADLPRTSDQRRADALEEMARRSAAMDPHAVMPRPLFTVLVGYEGFSNVCELSDGTVVTPHQLVPPPRRRGHRTCRVRGTVTGDRRRCAATLLHGRAAPGHRGS